MYLKSYSLLTNTLSTHGLYPYHQMATAGNQHVVLFHNKDTFIFLNEPLKKLVILKNVGSSANFVSNGRWKIFEGFVF